MGRTFFFSGDCKSLARKFSETLLGGCSSVTRFARKLLSVGSIRNWNTAKTGPSRKKKSVKGGFRIALILYVFASKRFSAAMLKKKTRSRYRTAKTLGLFPFSKGFLLT